jgi:hypothetical protein
MRVASWALVVLAGLACSRRSLQEEDGGGPGSIGLDAATDGGGVADAGAPFGLDASGSRVDAWSPPLDGGRICNLHTIRGHKVPTDILVVRDRSIGGDPASWNALLSTLAGQITATDAWADWGLYVFPKNGPACDASTVTAAPDLPFVGATAHLIAHLVEPGSEGNGTPTAAAIASAAAYLRTFSDDKLRFLLLLTDGAPTCAGTNGALSDDAVLAQLDAMTAIAAAQADGFRTIVAAPSTATDVAALNALAEVGGSARQGDVRFFTESTLREALFSTRFCKVSLGNAPPAPDDVTVYLDHAVVPRDRSRLDGWEYTDTSHLAIQLYGGSCDTVATAPSYELTVVYGCPTFDL